MCSCFQNYMDRQYTPILWAYSTFFEWVTVAWGKSCSALWIRRQQVYGNGELLLYVTPLTYFILVSSCQVLRFDFEAWTLAGQLDSQANFTSILLSLTEVVQSTVCVCSVVLFSQTFDLVIWISAQSHNNIYSWVKSIGFNINLCDHEIYVNVKDFLTDFAHVQIGYVKLPLFPTFLASWLWAWAHFVMWFLIWRVTM